MRQHIRVTAAIVAILYWVGASAAPLEERFHPGVSYYFENFDPAMKPWDPGQDLNIEEVFKNYDYYEIIFDQSGREIVVNRYLQNRKVRSDRFLIRPDLSLEAR
ncbi:MAG: hypothetical protein HY799_10685 [Nitrosomonadales bacterium]|nr:hypothetical protein [Nitrosomonadales bacterium]